MSQECLDRAIRTIKKRLKEIKNNEYPVLPTDELISSYIKKYFEEYTDSSMNLREQLALFTNNVPKIVTPKLEVPANPDSPLPYVPPDYDTTVTPLSLFGIANILDSKNIEVLMLFPYLVTSYMWNVRASRRMNSFVQTVVKHEDFSKISQKECYFRGNCEGIRNIEELSVGLGKMVINSCTCAESESWMHEISTLFRLGESSFSKDNDFIVADGEFKFLLSLMYRWYCVARDLSQESGTQVPNWEQCYYLLYKVSCSIDPEKIDYENDWKMWSLLAQDSRDFLKDWSTYERKPNKRVVMGSRINPHGDDDKYKIRIPEYSRSYHFPVEFDVSMLLKGNKKCTIFPFWGNLTKEKLKSVGEIASPMDISKLKIDAYAENSTIKIYLNCNPLKGKAKSEKNPHSKELDRVDSQITFPPVFAMNHEWKEELTSETLKVKFPPKYSNYTMVNFLFFLDLSDNQKKELTDLLLSSDDYPTFGVFISRLGVITIAFFADIRWKTVTFIDTEEVYEKDNESRDLLQNPIDSIVFNLLNRPPSSSTFVIFDDKELQYLEENFPERDYFVVCCKDKKLIGHNKSYKFFGEYFMI